MDKEGLWKSVLAELERSVSKLTFQTHFAHTQLASLVDNVATISFPNSLLCRIVETRYAVLVKSILDHHTNGNSRLIFTVIPKDQRLSMLEKLAGQLALGNELKFTVGENKQSIRLRAGTRTYFFNIQPTKNGQKYLEITETRFQTKTADHKRASLVLFPEKAQEFAQLVSEMAARLV